MPKTNLPRRALLVGAAGAVVASRARPAAARDSSDNLVYEINRSEAEWRDLLSNFEFDILRNGKTEPQRSSPLWKEKRSGNYCCRGCDLTIYKSLHKLQLSKGWAFFRHSLRNTVMTDLDLNGGQMGDPFAELAAGLEVHCRRCGSHLGHIVSTDEVRGKPIHCINGAALRFEQADV